MNREYVLSADDVKTFSDGSVGMHFEDLAELYDSTELPQEWSYLPHDDPQLETEIKVDPRIKRTLMEEALIAFFEGGVIDYVQTYVENHGGIDRIIELDSEYTRADIAEAKASYYESRYDDY